MRLSPREAFGVARLDPTDRSQDLTGRVRGHLEPCFGPGTQVCTANVGRLTLFAVTHRTLDLEGALVAWGQPLAPTGPVPDDHLARILTDPSGGRDLAGSWAVAGWIDGGVRIVTTSDLAAVIRRATHGPADAVATRGGIALAAIGRPHRLETDRIAEFVLHDYVFGSDELLGGVEALPEATIVDLGHEATAISTYWSDADRLGLEQPPTDADDLAAALERALSGLVGVPRAWLGLTGGRDSRLVAATLADLGAAPVAFTMGGPPSPDAVEAARVARHLGWRHETLEPAGAPRDFGHAATMCRWTDGLDTARNHVGSPLPWPGPRDVTLVSGSGGETGRAFYWKQAAPVDPVRMLASHPGPPMLPATQRALEERARRFLDRVVPPGCGPERALDLAYARGRMHKWLGNGRPDVPVRGVLAAFTGPEVTSVLLRLPTEVRRRGAAFDELLARRPWLAPPGQPARDGHRKSLLARLVRRAFRRAPAMGTVDPGTDPLRRLVAHLDQRSDVVIPTLGRAWWEHTSRAAASDPNARRLVWNAVTVEALVTLHE